MSEARGAAQLPAPLRSPAYRRVQSILLVCLVGWAVFTLRSVAQGHRVSALINLGVTLGLFFARQWARAREERAITAGHLGAALNGLGLTAVSLIQGQSAASASWFLVAAPLYAGFTIGLRGARLWSAIAIAALAVVHFSGYVVKIRPEFVDAPYEVWLVAAVFVAALFALALATLRVQEQDLAAIRARNALIERHAGELERARDAAVAGGRARDEFLALMSHEVRTPLTGILGMAELLVDDAASAEQRARAETIRSCGDALRVILDDILDAAKMEAGKLAIEPRPFRLRAALEQLVQLQRANAEKKGLALRLVVAAEVPDLLHGDVGRVRQVVLNLLSNAVKFTDAGSIDVAVDVRAAEPDPQLHVAVRDTGVGIEEAVLARLFQPFVQADPSARRRFEGTGLGLSISRRLARLMGGDVWAESAPGRGSTFHLTFALREAQALDDVAATPASALATAPKRVLLVEDNEVNQRVARGLLARLGHDSTVASTGLEALALLEEHGDDAFDVVLMDLRLPGLDGLETTRRIRARAAGERRLWIVAMTANASAEDRAACLRAGMDDFLAKPTPLDALARVLARAGQRRLDPHPERVSEAIDELVDRARVIELLDALGAPSATDATDATAAADAADAADAELTELVAEYARDGQRLRARLRAAVDAADARAVETLAHELKGASALLGAARARGLAAILEENARRGWDGARAAATLDELDACFEETIAALRVALADRR